MAKFLSNLKVHPPVTHLTPHKQFHQERTKYPNIGAYGDHYNSNHHTYASACDPN